jgi:AcrR family transcriptional regulator
MRSGGAVPAKRGRPKEHGDRTREALLVASEDIVAEGGPDALSVRTVAARAGTTTRAVYSLFGSRDGLLVALAIQAMNVLDEGVRRQRETDDPAADLVDLGVRMYRRFVLDHPSLFRLAFQRIVPELPLGPEFFETREKAFGRLIAKVQRLIDAGQMVDRAAREGAVEFNALCEGLANAELRGGAMTPGKQDEIWRRAFDSMVSGFSAPHAAHRIKAARRRGAR